MLRHTIIAFNLLVLAFGDHGFIGNGIQKRELNWNSGNQNIKSDENINRNIKVNYFRPSPQSDSITDNEDYMAFTLYSRTSDTGTFYFVKTATAMSYLNSAPCGRMSRHALAYYHFFKKCPEEEQGLIASGFCYRGTRNPPTLVYNSDTFNQGKSMSYLNREYYKDDDSRVVDPYEQGAIQYCYNLWKNAGFPLTSWTCALSNVPGRRKRAAIGTCTSCTCDAIVTSGVGLNHSGITAMWCVAMVMIARGFLI